MTWFSSIRWLFVAMVLLCCSALLGAPGVGADDAIDPAFNIFSDAPQVVAKSGGPIDVVTSQPFAGDIDPAFNIFSDAPVTNPAGGTAVASASLSQSGPPEIEVEIWVRDQCTFCDAWFQALKADAAKRRSQSPGSYAPRIRWIVRTDVPPVGVKSLPYSRFTVGGQMLEKSGFVTPDGVIQDWLKWSSFPRYRR